MDRRLLLAFGLMLIVLLVPSILWPPATRRPAAEAIAADSDTSLPSATGETLGTRPAPMPLPQPPQAVEVDTAPALPPAQVVTVESDLYRFRFSTRGGHLVSGVLKDFKTFVPGDTGRADLIPAESQFLEYALVIGPDTVSLADWVFTPSDSLVRVRDGTAHLQMEARRGRVTVSLDFTFRADSYLFDVSGEVHGLGTGGLVLVRLGPRLAFTEADTADDVRSYSVVTKAGKTERHDFRKLDLGERRSLDGPFEWTAIKSKYFLAALLTIGEDQPTVAGVAVTGGLPIGRHKARAEAVATLPAPSGHFSYSMYVGPQEYRRLKRIGHDLEDVNPYGWVLRPVIRPFANLIVVVLLWMHETMDVGYGWVLILFGLAVRLLLWPLNQKAMRSSMAMQAVQPELKAVQERYKQDPQRMQQEVMKLYKEHGVNPLGGCLPMLIPMPVLFALFFVFRQTIEFRGVPFLWLPDLSRADPFFIIPILMGVSMFVVSKLGQRGVPPNPQAKMMLYVMPAFLTFIFLRLSSGLNLYYAVSNIASIPQQWMISQERMRRVGKREPS
jgi:YidC/Oxa1 family membrane protein insertase